MVNVVTVAAFAVGLHEFFGGDSGESHEPVVGRRELEAETGIAIGYRWLGDFEFAPRVLFL